MASSDDIRGVRERKCKLGQRLLTEWASRDAADRERAGAQANRTLERARRMRDGITASTATHDKRGMPLLNSVERSASQFGNSLSVKSWVDDLPRELRNAVIWHYVGRKTLDQVGEMLGVQRKEAGALVRAAEVYIAERILATRPVNDPSYLLEAL